MTEKTFIHFHTHSSTGSMVDSINNIEALFERAAEMKMPALALTDHGTCAAWFDARKASKKYGVKFIAGIEAYFTEEIVPKAKRKHIVLLATNEVGYKNLLRLNYEGYLNAEYVAVMNKVFPRIDWNLLEKYHEGIVCLTACGSGLISRQMFVHGEDGQWLEGTCHENVIKTVQRLKDIFGDNLYLELQPHNLKIFEREKKTGEVKIVNGKQIVVVDQNHINRKLIEVGKMLGVKLVATADVHYLNKEDAKAHDMLMAISSKAPLSDKMRHRYEVEEFYMKSYEEIHNHFEKHFGKEIADEVCDNTMKIANQCEDPVYLDPKGVRFPAFDVKAEKDYEEFLKWKEKEASGVKEDHAFMRFRCVKGFKQKYRHLKGEEKKKYIARMKEEIKIFELHNFCSYMLVVSDFIQKAKEQDIFIGVGRGSVAASVVGYVLGIHNVEPIQYNLIFERFHNKEKKAFPDIDTDISPDGRDWVMDYITNKYGKEKVAHVSNLSRMTPKVVVKDIARSMELGGSKSKAFEIANKITDTIPSTAKTIDEALSSSPDFRNYCIQYPTLEEYGRKLCGLEKAYATHAAGIVISDIDLSTYVPLRTDKEGVVSVQYEKNRCEEMGLIKMDLLGLEHLRILKNTINNARKLGLECPNPENIPLDDQAVWEDLGNGKTMCVFQMESPHMKSLCKQIKPKNIDDLSAINALGRPSAGQKEKGEKYSPRDLYILRRDGKEKTELKYKYLENSLGFTLGVCMYEEQLMFLAKDVAGWDFNEADVLRKITKLKEKGKELVEKVEKKFIDDAVKMGRKKEEIEDIWNNIIFPYSKYGFNRGHSIAYSINGFHTAWYKHYFPAPFMAAVLEAENNKGSSPDRDANIREYKKECKRMGIKILPPSINKSDASFSVLNKNTIISGLEAIKGVGSSAVSNMIETRNKHSFVSFADFLYRTKSSTVKKDVIQALAQAGALDELKITRKGAYTFYGDIRTKAKKYAEKNEELGIIEHERLKDFVFDNPELNDEWEKAELIKAEVETLGEAISGNMNDLYDGFFTNHGITTFSDLKVKPNGASIKIEAIIGNVKEDKLKKGKNNGKTYARLTVSDVNNEVAQITAWPDQLIKYRDYLEVGKALRAVCRVNVWNDAKTLILDRIENIK